MRLQTPQKIPRDTVERGHFVADRRHVRHTHTHPHTYTHTHTHSASAPSRTSITTLARVLRPSVDTTNALNEYVPAPYAASGCEIVASAVRMPPHTPVSQLFSFTTAHDQMTVSAVLLESGS